MRISKDTEASSNIHTFFRTDPCRCLRPNDVDNIEDAMAENTRGSFWNITELAFSPTVGQGENWPN